MYKSKCPVCGSTHTVKNGKRKGRQMYKCAVCGYQFRNSKLPSDLELWQMYQANKQTFKELAEQFKTSESTIKRRIRNVSIRWEQPPLFGGGFVHLDATYWGHNWGVILALDDATGRVLYLEFIQNETNADYEAAVRSIQERGYEIQGLIVDGKQSLFGIFSAYKMQMCQFHIKQIVKRHITLNPKLLAARALNEIMKNLTSMSKDDFVKKYTSWKESWKDTLNKRSVLKNSKTRYRHRRLRTAVRSIDFYLPYLFTYQEKGCEGMPNTNNKIEGIFTDLKKNLNNHSGMSKENCKRFISGFFLALE